MEFDLPLTLVLKIIIGKEYHKGLENKHSYFDKSSTCKKKIMRNKSDYNEVLNNNNSKTILFSLQKHKLYSGFILFCFVFWKNTNLLLFKRLPLLSLVLSLSQFPVSKLDGLGIIGCLYVVKKLSYNVGVGSACEVCINSSLGLIFIKELFTNVIAGFFWFIWS